MREGFALQRAEIKELRAEQRENNKALGEKLDRLMESLLADKQPLKRRMPGARQCSPDLATPFQNVGAPRKIAASPLAKTYWLEQFLPRTDFLIVR